MRFGKEVFMAKSNGKKAGVTKKIFISLLLGVLAGMVLHYWIPAGSIRDQFIINGVFYVVGNGFLRAMQMLVVPLVFCSLVVGSMSIGDTKSMGKIGGKTILFYLLTTAIAITLALGIGYLFQPGKGLDITAIESSEVIINESTGFADTLLNIIPSNPVKSLVEGNMLQIIVFALLVGVILAKLGTKVEVVGKFFAESNDIMMEMTNIVMKFAPYGVFCLIAKTFSEIGLGAFIPLLKYIIAVYVSLLLHCLVTYMGLFKGITKLNPVIFIKKFFPVMGFAFSTASSNATIPYSIETLEKEIGVPNKIASFTIPLGATINMDGTAIMQGVAVMFAAQAFGIHLTPSMLVTVVATATLASIGTAGVPGVGLITLSMVFTSVGLPIEAIALIMGVDRIIDMTRTAVNIVGDAICSTIIAHQEGVLDLEVYSNEKELQNVIVE